VAYATAPYAYAAAAPVAAYNYAAAPLSYGYSPYTIAVAAPAAAQSS
jgi:hypothetical protein